ncbi:hypothetical protein RIF29_13897 [Crotalaria pallida]|uniref:RING-type domain-containing protein n=1 Tax=Crotalaria pallida TaxID=3830 RepID=A0AAN9IB31_CROPI
MACCSPCRLISIIVTIIAIIGGVFVAHRLKGEAIVFLLPGVPGLIMFVLIVLLEGQIEHKEYEDNIEQAKWEKENRLAREIRDLENQLAREIDLLGDQIVREGPPTTPPPTPLENADEKLSYTSTPPPLSKEEQQVQVVGLPPLKTFTPDPNPKCLICMQEFNDGDVIQPFGICLHEFHSSCLQTWLSIPKTTCPACRQHLSKGT